MKSTHLIRIALLIVCPYLSYAQVPFVASVNKTSARVGDELILQGINFGANTSHLKVVFGGVSVAPTTLSDQLIQVKIPAGATFDNIRVLNTTTGLSGASQTPFFVSYGGTGAFRIAATNEQSDFDSENGLYDLATADFDGDGKLDVVTANDNANTISVHRNTSSTTAFSFVKTQLNTGTKTIHVAAGDLNGDGKPEIIVTEQNASRVFVFKNTSVPGSVSFVMSTLTLSGSKANQVRVADLDLDGRQELIITDQSTSRFFILPNQSSLSTISFGTSIIISPGGTSGTDGIDIQDLNGDRFPEIVVSEFLNANGDIFVLENSSAPGLINFQSPLRLDVPSTVSNLRVGDLNADGKPDIAATLLLSQGVLILRNESTSSELLFSSGDFFEANQQPWGLDFGDVDGDGKTDIAIASITQKAITILSNQSTTSTFTFTKNTKATNYINRHVRIADMDVDGRPDFAFTSINDGNLGITASKVSIVKNSNCVLPVISPAGPLTICSSFTQLLEASASEGTTYEWFKDGVSMGAPGASSSLSVTASGAYSVRTVSDGGTCTETSQAVTVTVVTQAPLGLATPVPVDPVCIGGTLSLSVNDVGASEYRWVGPENFVASGVSISRNGFLKTHAGIYTLEVLVGTCVAQVETLVVDAVAIPEVQVTFSGSDIICQGQTKTLSFYPKPESYNYQWKELAAGSIAGASSATHVISNTGKYGVEFTSTTNPTCPPVVTEFKKVRVVATAVAAFTHPATSCVGVEVDFVNESVADVDPEDPEINYEWTFGSTLLRGIENPTFTFDAAQSFPVSLTVTYRNGVCGNTKQSTISITQSPEATLRSSSGVFSFCEGEGIELSLQNTFDTYLWSTGETTPSIFIEEAGTYTVDLTVNNCEIESSKTISVFNTPVVSIQAEPPSANLGDEVTLSATGLVSYLWRPNKELTDSLSAIIQVTPTSTTTYVVSGIDNNGCVGTDSVEVFVIPEDNILSLLKPKNYFSPNGDMINQYWEVEGIEPFQCSVIIYDEKGLKVYENEAYDNLWDGTSLKGQMLPVGVYFYVIRCMESGDRILSGSISIVR